MHVILQHIPRDIDVDALINALTCEEDEVRCLAGVALGYLDIGVEKATDQLSALLLAGERSCYSRHLIVALEKIELARKGVIDVDALRQDLLSDHDSIRARAAALLGSVASTDSIPTAIAALRSAMSDSSVGVRHIIIDAFERIGRPAIPAVNTSSKAGGLECEPLKAGCLGAACGGVQSNICIWSKRRSSASCRRMYSRIAVSSRPTVEAKYPRAQKCCPVKFLRRPPTVRAM